MIAGLSCFVRVSERCLHITWKTCSVMYTILRMSLVSARASPKTRYRTSRILLWKNHFGILLDVDFDGGVFVTMMSACFRKRYTVCCTFFVIISCTATCLQLEHDRTLPWVGKLIIESGSAVRSLAVFFSALRRCQTSLSHGHSAFLLNKACLFYCEGRKKESSSSVFSYLTDFEGELDEFQSMFQHEASLSLHVLSDNVYHDIAKFHVYTDAIATRISFDASFESI